MTFDIPKKLNTKNIIIYFVIPSIAAIGIYALWVVQQIKKKEFLGFSPETNGVAQPNPSAKVDKANVAGTTVKSGSFPLKKGMTSDAIKQLQTVLGVTPISGYFGSLTQSALLEQVGKTQIDSQDDFDKIIAQILAQDAASTVRQNKAQSILNTYNQSQTTSQTGGTQLSSTQLQSIYFLNDSTWHSQDDNYVMYWSKGSTANLGDYNPVNVSSDGYLTVYCNKGDNKGYWVVEPTAITLK